MRIILLSLVVVGAVFLSAKSISNELPKSAWKKIEKEWSKLWPNQEVIKEVLNISDEINSQLSNAVVPESLFSLKIDTKLVGYLFIDNAPSRYDKFDYMVIYNPDLTIKTTKILIYREDWGGEISSFRWLKQFIGLSASNKIQLDYDIQGISGATISCQSATKGINKLTITLDELKNHGVIN